MTDTRPKQLAGCVVSTFQALLMLAIVYGAAVCFGAAMEWSRGKTTMGPLPSNPIAAALSISVGGIALLAVASSLFPIRSYLRGRRESTISGVSPMQKGKLVRSTLLTFFILLTVLASMFTLTAAVAKGNSETVTGAMEWARIQYFSAAVVTFSILGIVLVLSASRIATNRLRRLE